MCYLYIKQSKFDICKLIIKTNNDKLILNYHIPEANITLKNIILKIRNKILFNGINNIKII